MFNKFIQEIGTFIKSNKNLDIELKKEKMLRTQ